MLDDSSEFIAYHSVDNAALSIPRRFRLRPVAGSPYLRLGFDLARKLKRDRPDLVHVQYNAPLACPAPVVVTVHDVSFLRHPEYFPAGRALQLRLTVRRTVRMAARVLSPSEFSRRAVMRAYGLDEQRVVVIPNAVASDFHPVDRELAAAEIASRFGIPSPFILMVGDLQPRKNQEGLIHAFAELLREYPQLPHHLVLVGKDCWDSSRIRRAAAKSSAAERIHFTGFVSDEALVWFYGACEVFAFPSFYEGFGLPILEAMACGRAVACSNTTAIPEVADAAAILFNPNSTAEIVRALRDLLLDAELRRRIERLGLQRAAAFTWRNTARRTLDVYYDVAGDRRRAASRIETPAAIPSS